MVLDAVKVESVREKNGRILPHVPGVQVASNIDRKGLREDVPEGRNFA
jgi:hypothetical protein